MKKCERENCEHAATHSTTLNMPSIGVPIDLHSPLKMYVGIELCQDHAKELGKQFKWSENQSLKEAVVDLARSMRRADVDFDRTFHSVIKLTDPGYLQFLKTKKKD